MRRKQPERLRRRLRVRSSCHTVAPQLPVATPTKFPPADLNVQACSKSPRRPGGEDHESKVARGHSEQG